MKNEVVRIAVADASVIVRSGVVVVLRHLPDVSVQPVEITSPEGLHDCMQAHVPDILIVNPTFGGWFNIETFKNTYGASAVKIVALLSNLTDPALLKDYDDKITILDDPQAIGGIVDRLLHQGREEEDEDSEQESLSQREKEIIVCVVKGMINKEIADQLNISIHTVITHRRNISRKLQIHSPSGLTIYAIVNKLVDVNEIKL